MIADFAIDTPAGRPPFVTVVGPTFDPEDLAGRKLDALFGRAEARDFTDVFSLAQRFDRSVLLERAAEVDPGFDPVVPAEMMCTMNRFDDDPPVDGADVETVRESFRRWVDEIDRSPGE